MTVPRILKKRVALLMAVSVVTAAGALEAEAMTWREFINGGRAKTCDEKLYPDPLPPKSPWYACGRCRPCEAGGGVIVSVVPAETVVYIDPEAERDAAEAAERRFEHAGLMGGQWPLSRLLHEAPHAAPLPAASPPTDDAATPDGDVGAEILSVDVERAAAPAPARVSPDDGWEMLDGWASADWADTEPVRLFRAEGGAFLAERLAKSADVPSAEATFVNGQLRIQTPAGQPVPYKAALELDVPAQANPNQPTLVREAMAALRAGRIGEVALRATNAGETTVRLSVALAIGADYTYFESLPMTVAPGHSDAFVFPALDGKWKSAASNWQNTASVAAGPPRKIMFVIHAVPNAPAHPLDLWIDQLQLRPAVNAGAARATSPDVQPEQARAATAGHAGKVAAERLSRN